MSLSPPLAPGDKLGPYEILEPIGKGGMGEVYRARDTRLKRDVAIKIAAAQFSERFDREARAIAALNHANICHLYDVGPNYLVMELVEGPTLAERIKQGPIPLEEALAIVRQVAAALEAAHDKGITHRDLKPGNIKIRTDGVVKVLDFGLAKIGGTPAVQSDESPTLTMGETEQGMILGTASYMSPEQAKGKPVDQRSDIYAFGLVLYEMVTGKRLHRGETTTEVLASVIKDEPQWDNVPAQVQLLLRRCLEKDPQKRLRHIADAIALVDERAPTVQPAPAVQPAKTSWLWPSVAAGLVIGALGITAWALWPKPAAPARATRFQVTLPEGVQFSQFVSLSPDGHKLVFNATGTQSGLWIHDLDTLEWRKLPGTEGGRSPIWSPDNRYLAFGVGNQLKKIEIAGGPPQTLGDSPVGVGSGAWNSNGVIVFGAYGNGPLRRVLAAGGVVTEITAVDRAHGETAHSLPVFLPDGTHFLYLRQGAPEVAGIYAGSLDAKPSEQSKQRILATPFAARFVDGNLFFMRDGTLVAQPFDSGRLQLRGEPVPVAEHVATTGAIGIFSVSTTGVLAYRAGADEARSLTWLDRQAKETEAPEQPGNYYAPALSQDATRAAFRDALDSAAGDIWVLDFARGVRTRLTFRQSAESYPVWSPDGSRIFFASGDNLNAIYEKAANGAGEEKELLKTPGVGLRPTSVSHDGRFLLYYTAGAPDLWVLPLEGDHKPALLLGTRFVEALGSFSPDGRWLAYLSNESGRAEVYVRPFKSAGSSGPSLGEGKWQVSRDGAAAFTPRIPRWRGDGTELFFADLNGSPMAVDVSANGAAFQAGVPRRLFDVPGNQGWDVTADGKRFLVVGSPLQGGETPITVVLNWQADLKK